MVPLARPPVCPLLSAAPPRRLLLLHLPTSDPSPCVTDHHGPPGRQTEETGTCVH